MEYDSKKKRGDFGLETFFLVSKRLTFSPLRKVGIDMTGTQYERFVRAVLVKRLGLDSNKLKSVRSQGVTFPGGSPVKHQIDLVYTEGNEIAEYKTIIECKYRSKDKVDQEEIAKIAFVKTNLRASKAIMITNNGFTEGADALAESEKIALIVLAPKLAITEIMEKTEDNQLFSAIQEKLDSTPASYDMDIQRRLASSPNDKGSDLIGKILADPTIREHARQVLRDPVAQGIATRMVRENPEIARIAMDFFGKKF